jgi:hypothetical protein
MIRVLNERGADAVGARVRIEADGRVQWRAVQPAYSFCASNDPRVHAGVGYATAIDAVTVYWPDGHERHLGPLQADKLLVVQR